MFKISEFVLLFIILECIHQFDCLANDEDKKREWCSNKFNITTPVITYDNATQILHVVKNDCVKDCISPRLREGDELRKLSELMCSSLENTRENNEKLQMCFSKYSLSIQVSRNFMNEMEWAKFTCALKCINPAYSKIVEINDGTNGTKFEKMCEHFENTPENNQKLETCFANYNASKSWKNVYPWYDAYMFQKVKFACVVKCVSPYLIEPNPYNTTMRKFRNETEFNQICRSIEITPEYNAKKQACFDKYPAPTSKPDQFDDVAAFNFKCALFCASPELVKVISELDDRGVTRLESRCQSVETPTQNSRQVDDQNSNI